MKRRRVELFVSLLLVAGIAAAVVISLSSSPARGAEGDAESTYDPGPYGIPEGEMPTGGPAVAPFSNIKPVVPLKDLPKMQFPFGAASEPRPEKSVDEMTPEERELHDKIEWLKKQPNPFSEGAKHRKPLDDNCED